MIEDEVTKYQQIGILFKVIQRQSLLGLDKWKEVCAWAVIQKYLNWSHRVNENILNKSPILAEWYFRALSSPCGRNCWPLEPIQESLLWTLLYYTTRYNIQNNNHKINSMLYEYDNVIWSFNCFTWRWPKSTFPTPSYCSPPISHVSINPIWNSMNSDKLNCSGNRWNRETNTKHSQQTFPLCFSGIYFFF